MIDTHAKIDTTEHATYNNNSTANKV